MWTNEKIKFILAEDIRGEDSGRMTIMGYATNNQLLLPVPAESLKKNATAIEITIGCIVNDLSTGMHTAVPALYGPGNRLIAGKTHVMNFIKEKNKTATLVSKFRPLQISEYGIYKFVIDIDNAPSSFEFEITSIDEFEKR